MNEKIVRRLNLLTTAAVGAIAGLAGIHKNAFAALIAVALGLILIRFTKSKAKAEGIILEDERIELIASKASYKTIQAVALILLTLGFALNALNNSLGDVLLFIVCLILVTYLAFYRYYASKFGGL